LKCTAPRSPALARKGVRRGEKNGRRSHGARLASSRQRPAHRGRNDFAVGFSDIKKIGKRVEKDEPMFSVHARNDQSLRSVLPLLEEAVEIG
jgi:thymidine phosphorylase